MKKTLSVIALAIMGMFAVNASAQAPDSCQNCPKGHQPMLQNKMYQPREFKEFAFEGILLDIDQQTRIDSLNAAVEAKAQKPCAQAQAQNCDKACKDGKQCDKPCKDAKKCDKPCKDGKQCDKPCKDGKKCDKAGAEAQGCKNNATCEKGGMHGPKGPHKMQPRKANCPYGEEYIEKVKEILTPDQYVVFLENIVNMPAKMAPAMQGQPQNGKKGMPSAKDGRKKMQPRK